MINTADEIFDEPMRCTIVVDRALPPGLAANAAAVIALTLGKRHPDLTGADLVDGSGHAHPGLIPIGIAILAAASSELGDLRTKAMRMDLDVVDFPVQGQQTVDYAEFGARVGAIATEALTYVGIGVYGSRRTVGRVVGKFSLLR